MYLASGVATVPKMLKAELNLSIGLDGGQQVTILKDMIELGSYSTSA